jgi:hypothetical protein
MGEEPINGYVGPRRVAAASRSALELYSAIILPRLADGPRTLHELGRTAFRRAPLEGARAEHGPAPLMDCAAMDFTAMGVG